MIKIFNNSSELTVAFCDELLNLCNMKQNIFISLSGGDTPKMILKSLAEDYKNKIDWKKCNFFWGDERCVPLDDKQSNYGMTKDLLLNHIDIPQENIHRIKGEQEPEQEAARYSRELLNFVPLKNNLPNFDLMILGIGEDGHTASIFPDQMQLLHSEKICEVTLKPDTNQKRISLTGKVINNADRIIFLAVGDRKSKIIKAILEGDTKSKTKYPAANIHPVSGSLYFYIDKAAAKYLTKSKIIL